MQLTDEERKALAEKLGGMQNYNPVVLREMARQDRRFLAPLIMAILSAEFRGIDFFGRFVVESEAYNVPWHMTLAFARQTFDESRHTHLNMKLLEDLGSYVGEYPDIILGPGARCRDIPPEELDPAILIARINVALEGFALTTFEEIRELAEKIGETMVEHCHDYNMADEVTHVGDRRLLAREALRGAALAHQPRQGRPGRVRARHRDGPPDGRPVRRRNDERERPTRPVGQDPVLTVRLPSTA